MEEDASLQAGTNSETDIGNISRILKGAVLKPFWGQKACGADLPCCSHQFPLVKLSKL